MLLSKEDVLHVANLARLSVEPSELQEIQDTLSRVLEYIDLLNELDTEQVVPTSQVVEQHTVWRSDQVEKSLPIALATQNGPQVVTGMFVVPKILDGGGQ